MGASIVNVFEFILALLGISLVVLIVIGVLAFFGIRKLVRWVRRGSAKEKEFVALDQENGSPAEDIERVLKRHIHDRAIGSRARAALTQVASTTERQKTLTSIISSKFTRESLSWTKFIAVVDTACHVLNRNCTYLANQIQSFDTNDYLMLQRSNAAARLKSIQASGAAPSNTQIQRWSLMNANLQEMDNILAANDHLLLELDKFSAEIAHVGQEDAGAATHDILMEIQQLSDQAKLYQ